MFKIRGIIGASIVAAGLFLGSSASALCTNPSLGTKDTVLQFGSAQTTEAVGAIGNGSNLNARRAGTMYYDHVAGTMRLCDGSNWKDLEIDSGSVAGSFAQWAVWRKDIPQATVDHTPFSVPLEPTGVYKIILNVEKSDTTCWWYLHNNSDTPFIFVTKGNTGAEKFLQTSFTFYGRGGGLYSYALEGYGTDEANNSGTTNLDMPRGEQGQLRWNGRMVLNPRFCEGFVSIMRVE